ncbi:MAG: sialate O-acetylesterase [Oscillospiraceae bacterium]|nr:sialate O-acetylesterase [Oscillospiraceae bacterium]
MSIFSCAPVFSDHMVLQRGKNINVWGIGSDGSEVEVSLNGKTVRTAVKNHKWFAVLPPMEAGGAYEMTVSSHGETITFSDVMIGEVWLAGGQSNMELELQNSLDGKNVVKNIGSVNVRFYYTKKNAFMDDFFYADERDSCWCKASPETASCQSAVGYYFAKKLSEDLGVAVGIIGCNWGGTSASAWISREMLSSDRDTKSYVDEYDAAMSGKSFEQYCDELDDYNAYTEQWQPKINEFYRNNPNGEWGDALAFAGPCRYPEPLGPKSPFRAGGLYETMLKRVAPYTLAGFIYYQGESDDHKPNIYCKLLKMLIEQWRSDWNDDEMPFIFVQLPMHINRGEEDRKNWCLIREAQMRVHKTVANTGIAVALDCGEYGNIHPLDKRPVGERLELQALCHVYHKISEDKAYGAIYSSALNDGSDIVISFDYSKGGFEVRGERAVGFEVAGSDKKYFPANAVFEGERIRLSSEQVEKPEYARYNWVNYGEVTVFSKNGLPLAPFRTSRNDGFRI